jgi:Fe2+ or Zn2+ uptake regulation protein
MPTAAPHPDLAAALRARGLRVTRQRIEIERTVRELGGHVSAEDVLNGVGERLRGVSLPTVYSTLELLEELGSVRCVGHVAGRVLFDSRVDEHHHVVCSRCGRVEDIEAPFDTAPALAAAREAGFAGTQAGLTVTGICAPCRRDGGPPYT